MKLFPSNAMERPQEQVKVTTTISGATFYPLILEDSKEPSKTDQPNEEVEKSRKKSDATMQKSWRGEKDNTMRTTI